MNAIRQKIETVRQPASHNHQFGAEHMDRGCHALAKIQGFFGKQMPAPVVTGAGAVEHVPRRDPPNTRGGGKKGLSEGLTLGVL